MPDNKLTDSEIVKALECCSGKGDCRSCPYKNRENCTQDLKLETADLINRQKAEIERLWLCVNELKKEIGRHERNYDPTEEGASRQKDSGAKSAIKVERSETKKASTEVV